MGTMFFDPSLAGDGATGSDAVVPVGGLPVVDSGGTRTDWEHILDDLLNAGVKIAQIAIGPPSPVGGVGVRPPSAVPNAQPQLAPNPVSTTFGGINLTMVLLVSALLILALALFAKKGAHV